MAFVFCAFVGKEQMNFFVPKGWAKPQYDFSKNPLSQKKIQLGRALFYDPILSRNNTISCASCHSQYNAFAHVDHALSHGIEDRIGNRNAPALMNLAWQQNFMWDGAVNHLDVQSLAPISHPSEMDEKIENVLAKLKAKTMYTKLFFDAFGDSVVSSKNMLQSLAQFMLSLQSYNSKYDSVQRKQSSFTMQEQKGYQLFQYHCNTCHTEPLFSNYHFENNGLSVDTLLNDFGRIKITKQAGDSLKFKVPSLRNIEFTYPYMHDGRFKRISEVLNHYTTDIQQNKTLSPKLAKPIVLSSEEKVDLTAFLLTLTDKHFLFNPAYSYPKNIFLLPAKE